jgi:CRP/FNR family cyclic AMP-dependent transcriptional regulator
MISPERLRAYPYFAGASEESLRELAMATEELTFQEGQVLFREDQVADRLYILIRGEVDIQYELNTGEHRTVDTVVAGDVLVWSALVRPYRTTALAIARRTSEVIAVDSRELRELCERDRDLGFSLMTEIAQAASHRLEGARVQLATRG